ncbi:MAG: molybdopterin-dependent oxidoreductase [Candidatus Nitrosocosmicus sp.]
MLIIQMVGRLLNWRNTVLFICGFAAGIATIALSLIFKIYFNGLFVPEIASQTLVSLSSGQIESRAVETLGPFAKYSSFFGAVFVNILLYGFIGVLIGSIFNKINLKRFIKRAIFSSFISYIILLVLSLSFIILNSVPGQKLLIPVLPLSLLIISHLLYGFLYSFCFERIRDKKSSQFGVGQKQDWLNNDKLKESQFDLTSKPPSVVNEDEEIDYKKRSLLRALVVSAIALPIMYFGLNRLFSHSEQSQQLLSGSPSFVSQNLQRDVKLRPKGFENAILTPLIDSEVTPTYLFYRIDKNAIVPVIDISGWSLSIKGLVNNPLVLTYGDIKSMAAIEQYATLSCVSNKIGGDLVSTALWKGVRLKDILLKAQIKPGVKYIVFRCYDGYDVGIPIESGLMEGTILSYEMNNIALPNEHGYPLRAIVPGFYGMMNPKWITEIELIDATYEGFWQRKGWTNNGNNNIYSTIVTSGNQEITNRFPNLVKNDFAIGKPTQIAGIAFAGDKGISKVEVSTDGGNTWKTAIVKDPLSKYTWVLWTSMFTPKDSGDYKIVVRATDKTGNVQTSNFADPFPNGASGYDTIDIQV